LAEAGHVVSRAGLVVGSGGNLSARDPGSDRFWVTAAGTFLDRLDRDDFVPVPIDMDVGPARAERARPSTESALHAVTYAVRPDVNAVIHLHPQIVVLLNALGESIRLITTDHAYYVRRVATTPFHPPGSLALATVAADAVRDGTNCVVLAHHGCSVVGETVEMALRRAMNLEEAARLTYRALLLTGGVGPRPLPECPPIDAA
jgi:ribulose-5-phosphate 4-epimerase/fuculose-1-phosphate aldolase